VRKLDAEGDFTREEFQALCEKHGNACFRCGDGDVLLTPDHVIPLSVEGSNRITNIQPLCGSCSSWKNIKQYRPKRLTRARSLPTRASETPQKKQKEDLLRNYLESQHLPFAELAYAEYCAIFATGSRKIPIFCSNTFTKCDERGIVSVSVGAIPNRHN
jgi:hypothetical protein